MLSRVPLNFRGRADTWGEFSRRYAGNPFLELDPLYPLPEELIDAIIENATGLFTAGEEAFERDLAGVGRDDSDFDRRQAEAERQLRAMLAQEMEEGGASPRRVEQHFEYEAERNRAIASRVEAYGGWLVTNSQFHAERDALREAWGEQVETWGGFPTQRHSYLGEQAWSAGPKPAQVIRQPDWSEERWLEEKTRVNAPFEAFWIFYGRWCLERFETWDLPQPLWPEFYGFTTHDTFTLSEAGVHIFIPWHLLRDQKFTLRDLANHLKQAKNPTHLKGWLEKGNSKMGYVRLQRMYVLYHYGHLAIGSRYANRLEGNTGNTGDLDRAFASYMKLPGDNHTAAETVEKIRRALEEELSPPRQGN